MLLPLYLDTPVKPEYDMEESLTWMPVSEHEHDRGVGISVKRNNDMWGVGGCCWWMKKGL